MINKLRFLVLSNISFGTITELTKSNELSVKMILFVVFCYLNFKTLLNVKLFTVMYKDLNISTSLNE